MPWFPDFANAVELARRQTREAGLADPVAQYLRSMTEGDTHGLEDVWPGDLVIHDPRVGEVRGHRQLRRFVRQNQSFLAERHARIETVASTVVGSRAVVELLGHLDGDESAWAWPVAVVADAPDDRSVVFRTYCSQLPVDGKRHLRPAVLGPGGVDVGDVVKRYQAALSMGDADAILGTFAPDGTFASPSGAIGPTEGHRNSAPSSPSASAQEVASFTRVAWRRTTGCGAPWSTTACVGAAACFRLKLESPSMSEARKVCWPRCAPTTTFSHPTSVRSPAPPGSSTVVNPPSGRGRWGAE